MKLPAQKNPIPIILDQAFYASPQLKQRNSNDESNHIYEDIQQINLDFLNSNNRYIDDKEVKRVRGALESDDGNYEKIQQRSTLNSSVEYASTVEAYARLNLNQQETKKYKRIAFIAIVLAIFFIAFAIVAITVALVLTFNPSKNTKPEINNNTTPLITPPIILPSNSTAPIMLSSNSTAPIILPSNSTAPIILPSNSTPLSTLYSFNRTDLRRVYTSEENLVKQTEINLSSQNITTIEPNTFRGLNINIQLLDLTKNRINSLPFALFDNDMQNMEYFHLGFNQIDTIGVGGVNLANLIYLTRLYLNSNNLVKFSLRKLGLAYLQHLDLSSNRIAFIGDDMSNNCDCQLDLGIICVFFFYIG